MLDNLISYGQTNQEGTMEKKYFCCPECGARYRVLFNGNKYNCKKCSAPFIVPDDSPAIRQPVYPERKPEDEKKKSSWTKNQNSPAWLLVLVFFVVIWFVCSDCNTDKKKKPKAKAKKTAVQKKPTYTPEMYDSRWAKMKTYISEINNGVITSYNYKKHALNIIVTDDWYYTPEFQRERFASDMYQLWAGASAQAGFKDDIKYDLIVTIFDQKYKEVAYKMSRTYKEYK